MMTLPIQSGEVYASGDRSGISMVRYSTRSTAVLVQVESVRMKGLLAHTSNGRTWVDGGLAESMSLGGASLKKVPLHVHGTPGDSLGEGVDGLLGLSFLGNFKVSLNNGVLELSPLE